MTNLRWSKRLRYHRVLLPLLAVAFFTLIYSIPPPVYAQELQVTVDDGPPQWEYTGDTNGTSIEWEIGGAFNASWIATELLPDTYVIYWNQTGVNTTRWFWTYENGETVYTAYDPVLADVGHTIYFQLKLNDTLANTNSSIVYVHIVNTNPPTVTTNSPTNTTITADSIDVTLSSASQDLDTLWFSLYYNNGTAIEVNTTWTETVSRSLAIGGYYVVAYCNDTAGLEDSETTYFTIAETTGPAGGYHYDPFPVRVVSRLMEPLWPSIPWPVAGLLLSAVTGLILQMSQKDPTGRQQKKRKRYYVTGMLIVILYSVLRVTDAFSLLEGLIRFDFPEVRAPKIFVELWGRAVQPTFLGWPVAGVFIFGVFGFYHSNSYHPRDPNKQRLKQGFLIICGVALLYTGLILLQLPELVSSWSSNIKMPAIATPTPPPVLMERFTRPVHASLPFVTTATILIFTLLGGYVLLTTRPPRYSIRQRIRSAVAFVVLGGAIYSLLILTNPLPGLEKIYDFVIDIYT